MDAFFYNSAEILLLIFMTITFMQSAIDKILDWSGNVNWLKEHFAKTPLKSIVPISLGILLLVELAAGILCGIGAVQLFTINGGRIGFYGAVCCCIALIMLLFGQRMAKDYEGAKTIVIYFIPAIFLVYLLQP